MQVVAEVRFDVENMYKFHKEKSVDVAVDVWRLNACNVNLIGEGIEVDDIKAFGDLQSGSREGRKGGRGRGRGRGRRR